MVFTSRGPNPLKPAPSKTGSRSLLALLAAALTAGACSAPPEPPPEDRWTAGGDLTVVLTASPFSLRLEGATRRELDLFVQSLDEIDDGRYYDPTFDDPYERIRVTGLESAAATDDGFEATLRTDKPGLTLALKARDLGDSGVLLSVAAVPVTGIVHTGLSIEIAENEEIYGFGELFDHPQSRGKIRSTRFDLDGSIQSGYNERHVKAPVWVSTSGLGVVVTDPEPVVGDFTGEAHAETLIVAPRMEVALFHAPHPVETVARMMRHTGLPPLWPRWVFAPQQWRNELKLVCTVPCDEGCNPSQTGQDVALKDATDMRALDLPGSVIWVDAPWETGFNTFEFNPVQFPDAQGMIDRLHELGYRVLVWASPFVNRTDDSDTVCGMEGANAGGLYPFAKEKGYLVRNKEGKVQEFPWRGTQGALVDFTNPEAFEWWKSLLHRVTEMGVEGFKLDFDEYVVPALDTISAEGLYDFHDGSSAAAMHGRYHALFHRAHYEALLETHGEPGYLIGRSGDAYDGAWTTAIWPGDLNSGFEEHREPDPPGEKPRVGGLPAAVNAAISLAASGHPHFGSDIGGYREGMPDKEALGRWIEFGALSTVMQLGGAGEHHNPWDFDYYDQETLDIYRRYAKLHTQLHPYLYAYVARNSEDGTPIVRAAGLQYPNDPAMRAATYQYFFGADLLVAPVVVRDAREREVVFPEGR
ncbi:MAG: glycoside hydrolase family 31 protein, partial [Deltaproteobacteria bacterium]